MNWLRAAGIFLRQALKKLPLTLVFGYILDIAEMIAITLTKNTYIDDCFVELIKGIILIFENRDGKTIYDLGQEIGILVEYTFKKYEDLEKGKK